MTIYTKIGDSGETSLFGGKRVSKNDPQIEAYGAVDELSSFLGLIIAKLKNKHDAEMLTSIQKDLYNTMGALCGATTELSDLHAHVKKFEKAIDDISKKLPKQTRFILPQGGELASFFHVARTVCRRAERKTVNFFEIDSAKNSSHKKIIIQYLNRLSDYFFILARAYSDGKEIVT